MNLAPPSETTIAPELDGRAMQRALADLDSKLAKWTNTLGALRAGRRAGAATAALHVEIAAGAQTPPPEPCPVAQAIESAAAQGQPVAAEMFAAGPCPTGDAPARSGVPAGDDEESLLAALAPEVANALRIRRRLAGHGVSVRELLADYHLRPPQVAARPRTKSWFRWGDR